MQQFPTKRVNENFALSLYYFFKVVPSLIAAMAIFLGYKLFILGVTGQASLSLDGRGIKGQLLNAAPGLFFAIGGITALIVTVWKGVDISFDNRGGGGIWREKEIYHNRLKD